LRDGVFEGNLEVFPRKNISAFVPGGPKARFHTSPGQRPGKPSVAVIQALKGRSNHSPMNRPFRAGFRFPPLPRALPWAGIMRAFGPPQPDYPGGMGDPISTMKPGAFLRRMNQINVGNDKC